MYLKWIRRVVLLVAGVMLLTIPADSVYANCTTFGSAYSQGLTNYFTGCGPGASASAFVWYHGRGAQGIIGPETTANQVASTSGHDSANRHSMADLLIGDGELAGFPAGSFLAGGDPGSQGWDGCILNTPENPTGCGGSPDYGVMDYVIGGVNPAQPNIGLVAATSVDFNPLLLGWFADQAGAPAGTGVCLDDALVGNPDPITCGALPVPNITGAVSVPGGSNLTVGVGASNIPVLDDCNVAETRATNCPRNFFAGRALVFKRGACAAGTAATFDRRAWVYPTSPAAANLTVPGNWIALSNEDADLDGVLDAGEDGTNGGAVNGRLDAVIFAGPNQGAASTGVRIPTIPGASDCIYLGTALALDANRLAINPPTNTIFGEMVLSTVVSVNPNPISANTATPVADLVTTIAATKAGGKGKVEWTTGVEMTISGFNVIGTKKGGGNEVKINGTLVDAKEGTTGKGASYTFEFDASQLKGSSAVYIEVLKNNGSKARFGPASF